MSVTYPRGFQAAGLAAGLKASGRPDLGLLVSVGPSAAAGAFTTNTFPAAPVTLTRAHLARGWSRGIVVNSGQANAGTGEEGLADARAMAAAAAEVLGCVPEQILVCSTGVIGPRVPLDVLLPALPKARASLSGTGGTAFAESILTTDTRAKEATADAGPYRVGGCAKGAGMIAPRLATAALATLLAFVTTDAPVTPNLLARLVGERVAPVWNGVTVDGCQSTNDTVLVLAGGAGGSLPVAPGSAEATALGDALELVSTDLARQVVADAEGATRTLVVQVDGARDRDEARHVGLAVAGSALVKTAVFGEDPNPGRVLQALGDAGVTFPDPAAVRACLNGVAVVEGGRVPQAFDEDAARMAMTGPQVVLSVGLGEGEGSATVFGCDLGRGYIEINSRYRT